MAARPQTQDGMIKVVFSDIPSGMAVAATVTTSLRYQDFLSDLCTLSGEIVHQIEGLPHPRTQGQGLTLSDGPWWFRFVRRYGAEDQPRLVKEKWQCLGKPFDYDLLVAEAASRMGEQEGWVEVNHVWP